MEKQTPRQRALLVLAAVEVATDAIRELLAPHGYQVTGSTQRTPDGSIIVKVKATP